MEITNSQLGKERRQIHTLCLLAPPPPLPSPHALPWTLWIYCLAVFTDDVFIVTNEVPAVF